MYTVPDGMSPVNVFYALYKGAKLGPFFAPLSADSSNPSLVQKLQDNLRKQEKLVDSANKVARLLEKHLSKRSGADNTVDYVGGKVIKVDFSSFPKLDVSEYNRLNAEEGENAAKKVIEEYAKIVSSERFDANDFYTMGRIMNLSSVEEKKG